MQYLLTEEEYAEFQAIKVPEMAQGRRIDLELENKKLHEAIQLFVHHSEFTAQRDPQMMGGLQVHFRILGEHIPEVFSEFMRGRPNAPRF